MLTASNSLIEKKLRIVLVTNAPAPYREPSYLLLSKEPKVSLSVIYCTAPRINNLSTITINTINALDNDYKTYFLTKPYLALKRSFLHSDNGIIKLLNEIQPDVVITTGFIPTFLYAFFWTWWHGVAHIAMTDGTLNSERNYSFVHKLVRKFVFRNSKSFIGACQGSVDLFQSYGVAKEKLFEAPLAIDNQYFFNHKNIDKNIDFIFCGRLISHKNPLFALEVAAEVAKKLQRVVSIDFAGAGDQEAKLKKRANELKDYVKVRFHGYVLQEALPAIYKNAKVFLFPSEWDPWGVVANEACAAGLPVIVTPHAGVANELVIDSENGYIRELDIRQWAEAAADLLSNQALITQMGKRSTEIVKKFSFEAATKSMYLAIQNASNNTNNPHNNHMNKVIITSLMRQSGTTGVQTHVNTFTAYLDSISQPWQLVTPFNAPKLLLYPLLAVRRLIVPISPASAVWLYRKGHAWLLGIALKRVLKLNPNASIYAQCPVSANVALAKRQSNHQAVSLIVHFNISQADEWAEKGMIAKNGKIYNEIKDFERHVIPQVDKLIFVSAYMQKLLTERIPEASKVEQQVIPNFVVDPKPQTDTSFVADLISIGTLEPRKNQSYLIDIIFEAKKLGSRLTLNIVGDGPDRAKLENKTQILGISDQINFKGFIPNAASLMAKHQACIHVAKIENLPITLIEALAYAKPLFATAVGGVPELISDGLTGRVIPLDDANAAAKIIIQILKDPMQIKNLGNSARNYFSNNYDQTLVGKRLFEFISLPKLSTNQNLANKRVVAIVQRCIPIYRVPLFNHLKDLLIADNIELRLLYGDATLKEQTKRDTIDVHWGNKLNTKYFFDNRFCWQPFYSKVKGADLVIITQENKLVCNLWPLFGRRKYKLAFWGHGKNLQGLPNIWGKLKERMKYLTTNRVDWWFVYTSLGGQLVHKLGFPQSKITNLENSIDTTALKSLCDQMTSKDFETIRQNHSLGDGPVALFIGSLYQHKRLEFLLSACQQISQQIPNFKLIVIGDGPQRAMVEEAQVLYSWLRYVGRQTESNKAQYLKTASVLLNPGLVGLGILDSFAAGIPLVTTDCGLHSPEIDYLKNGENGFITANTVDAYVETVVRILTNPNLAKHLHNGSTASANHYTIENMAQNFRAGILKVLG
jgi:glycosyltransferase involved in cell wall biosynthesis